MQNRSGLTIPSTLKRFFAAIYQPALRWAGFQEHNPNYEIINKPITMPDYLALRGQQSYNISRITAKGGYFMSFSTENAMQA